MNNQPLVSIITPCYNGESFLHRYFGAILAQTYSNIELIFVNDGSKDRTEEIALSYKDRLENRGVKFIYLYQENAGQAAAINQGLKIFSGDFLIWPDCDDYMPPEYLKNLINYLLTHPDKGFVLSNCIRVFENDLNKITDKYERRNKEKTNIFEDLINETDIYWAAGGYMVRTEAFLRSLPRREIYVSNCGQNYQMLLPISYFYECGFCSDDEYKIIARQGSASRKNMTYDERLKAIDVQEKTVTETLMNISLNSNDVPKYARIVKNKYLNRRFELSFYYGEKKDSQIFYQSIKSNGKLTYNAKIKYLIVRSSILFLMYKTLRGIKRKLKKQPPIC